MNHWTLQHNSLNTFDRQAEKPANLIMRFVFQYLAPIALSYLVLWSLMG